MFITVWIVFAFSGGTNDEEINANAFILNLVKSPWSGDLS